jgi:protein TonB
MLSIVAHVIAACALIIAPLYATDTLPEPRSATEFIRVVPLATPTPPPVRLDRTPRVAANRDAAPIEVPDGIRAEEPFEPVNDAIEIDRNAIVFGSSDVPIADLVPPPPPPSPPVRWGENRLPQRVTDVAPVIRNVRARRGIVILEAVIGEDGAVRDVRVLRSLPLLDEAAIDAVRQWRFTPTLLNGRPVPVVITVTVAFKLRWGATRGHKDELISVSFVANRLCGLRG